MLAYVKIRESESEESCKKFVFIFCENL